jgi:hypothetical protein
LLRDASPLSQPHRGSALQVVVQVPCLKRRQEHRSLAVAGRGSYLRRNLQSALGSTVAFCVSVGCRGARVATIHHNTGLSTSWTPHIKQ